jgi:cell division septum initiation protein DivIVA
MNRKPWLVNALAVALLVPAALSCAGSKAPADPVAELRGGINEIVADEARAATMLAAVDQLEAAVAEADRLFADERAALIPMVRDHASSREEIERSLAEFNARHESAAHRFLAAHASLKAQATEAEWQELRKLEMSTLQLAASKSAGAPAPSEKED